MRKIFCFVLSVMMISLCGCSMPVAKQLDNTDVITQESGEDDMDINDVICGGTTDTSDYNAPKEIESDNLVSFSAGFYHEGKYDRSAGKYYTFYIEPDESGKLILKDNYASEGFEVDKSVLDGVQEIIKKYELARSNGIHKVTAGLAPQYQECFFEAKYDSGEYISYSGNSDPGSEWSGELVDYLANVFAENGDEKYLIPKMTGVITRFYLEVKEDGKIYSYDTIKIPTEDVGSIEDIATGNIDESKYETKIYRDVYDTSIEDRVEVVYAYPSPEYYEGLFNIISDMEIRDFENYDSISDFNDDGEPEAYYDFYIEFESGDRMSGAAVDPEILEKFEPLAKSLREYMDDYLDAHKE